MCVQRFRYFVKLSALAGNQFVGPVLFVSSYSLKQFNNKAVSTLTELPVANYHVRSQNIAVNTIYSVLFLNIGTRVLHITRKPTENFCILHEVERTTLFETTNARLSVYLLSTYTAESIDVPFVPAY